MKLMLCVKCNDVFNLSREMKACSCGQCGGKYVNEIDAAVHGDRKLSFVLGFSNSSLAGAISGQLSDGDLPATMGYAGKIVSPGREFTAFVIPESAPSVAWVEKTSQLFLSDV